MKILTTETKLGRRVQSGGCAIHCQNCSISQLCIPFTLNEHELNQLDNIIERKKPIQKSQVLFKAGDELTSIYAIRSGTIKSYTISETGEEQITSFHLPGDLVGFDAIMNMKGYAGHYGLERYKGVRAYNLGSQVPNEEFIKKAIELKADALLVSQTVTQKDVHIENLTNLVELLEAEGLRDKIILIAGGARITNDLAKELGYDAGFGPGKYADDVATFVLKEMVQRGMNTKK